MAEEFAVLESSLTDAAKGGNIDHVIALLRDVGKLHHLWQPNAAQAIAIGKAADACLRKDGDQGVAKPPDDAAATSEQPSGGEKLLKGYMVSSVNEWGADQTRILLISEDSIHRVKYNFAKEEVVSWHSTSMKDILRVEYGNFKAAGSSLTTFFWRRDIEDQQGFRIYTASRDGKKSINDVVSEEVVPALQGDEKEVAPPVAAKEEFFREYRALLAEDEPWKEEVFMLEVIAAMQAAKQLKGFPFEVRLTKMVKNIPGGVFTMMHNANRRRQHGF
mmetsp:Transcript_51303/g.127739  ORF Transcript_51303/g.127739 Transcript_51303/m.127739 type:complete len:275 (+) Transcript_51303:47-871(+)|eukprot:CAMPEP_0173438630 /NCGR_PEP_ID=MMETSP1357-20121228/20517_1 /TAXON_ID=77926 /ORGANISM="Hemiselmis rufescens, Strain PCC563" /LENGTH=274 /DNA_ID=CAMNT_0014403935 /DNA_START=46 /DNA_END=870 /DNA_ORIENTATION=+